jgi:hypothetical protein
MLVLREQDVRGSGMRRPMTETKSQAPGKARAFLRRFLKALIKTLAVPVA